MKTESDGRSAKQDLPDLTSLVSEDFRAKARELLEALSSPELTELAGKLRDKIAPVVEAAGRHSDQLVTRREDGELWDGWSAALRESTGAKTSPYETTVRLRRLAQTLQALDEIPEIRRELEEAIAWPEKPEPTGE